MKYLMKHRNTVTFLIVLLIVGIILGLMLGLKQDNLFKSDILNSLSNLKEILINQKINNIFSHWLISFIILILSFILPLCFINYIYILFKGICIGFSIFLFTLLLGIEGFGIGIIYNIISSLVFCIAIIFIIVKGTVISKNCLNLLVTGQNNIIKNIKKNIIAIIIMQIICLSYDVFLYIFSKNIIAKII